MSIGSYAGIGSRKINKKEESRITRISRQLSEIGVILYSGNADGADMTFQRASKGQCVVMLPWNSFNADKYNLKEDTLASYDMGGSKIGSKYTLKFHPNPAALSRGAKLLMNRNAHQILGVDGTEYKHVDFVVCCADVDKYGKVQGGTGHAVRIATSLKIPVINIRCDDWLINLKKIIKDLKNHS
jgi:hypothetical protein